MFDAAKNRYYTNLIKEDEIHYDRRISWDNETIRELKISMEDLSRKIRKIVGEQIKLFEGVQRRCPIK